MTQTIKRLTLATTAAAAVFAGVTALHAAPQTQNTNQSPPPFIGRGHGPGRPGGPMGLLPRLGRALQLTDSQRDQIKAIADSHRDEWKALMDRARTARQALDAAITADAVDETLIRQKSADVAAVEADIAVARARVHAEVWQVLTPDQKTKLNELRAQRANRAGRGQPPGF